MSNYSLSVERPHTGIKSANKKLVTSKDYYFYGLKKRMRKIKDETKNVLLEN